MPSFDVVSSPDLQEIDNAINNTKREVDNRFDFKNTNSTIERSDYSITIETTDNTKLNQFNDILKTKGLTQIDVKIGDKFDSENHEAITQIKADKEENKGTVIDIIEKGYKLGEKVIRYPKVVVAI